MLIVSMGKINNSTWNGEGKGEQIENKDKEGKGIEEEDKLG